MLTPSPHGTCSPHGTPSPHGTCWPHSPLFQNPNTAIAHTGTTWCSPCRGSCNLLTLFFCRWRQMLFHLICENVTQPYPFLCIWDTRTFYICLFCNITPVWLSPQKVIANLLLMLLIAGEHLIKVPVPLKGKRWICCCFSHLLLLTTLWHLNLPLIPSVLCDKANIMIQAVLTVSSSVLSTLKVMSNKAPWRKPLKVSSCFRLVWILSVGFPVLSCVSRGCEYEEVQKPSSLSLVLLLSFISICYAFSIMGGKEEGMIVSVEHQMKYQGYSPQTN